MWFIFMWYILEIQITQSDIIIQCKDNTIDLTLYERSPVPPITVYVSLENTDVVH